MQTIGGGVADLDLILYEDAHETEAVKLIITTYSNHRLFSQLDFTQEDKEVLAKGALKGSISTFSFFSKNSKNEPAKMVAISITSDWETFRSASKQTQNPVKPAFKIRNAFLEKLFCSMDEFLTAKGINPKHACYGSYVGVLPEYLGTHLTYDLTMGAFDLVHRKFGYDYCIAVGAHPVTAKLHHTIASKGVAVVVAEQSIKGFKYEGGFPFALAPYEDFPATVSLFGIKKLPKL